jgi:hypothetical protein
LQSLIADDGNIDNNEVDDVKKIVGA